ncbi:MAG: sulfurtransferase TusA family protein [Candidatus Jordarchaeales archaeon]|nr:sulfurtransferase TusA family protein [Candidatus Jordarchaeia archaeon]
MKKVSEEVVQRLDLKGEVCPVPVMRVRDKLKEMAPGEILEVICDCPPSKRNIQRLAEREGHEVVGLLEEGAVFKMYIKKK